MSAPLPPPGQGGRQPVETTAQPGGRGATLVRRRKHGLGWLPWAILALLVLLALAIWALASAADDDDDDIETTGTTVVAGATSEPGAATATTDPNAAPGATTDPNAAPGATTDPNAGGTPSAGGAPTTAPGAPAAGLPGSLVANGQDVVAVGSAGGLGTLAGAQVTGQAVVQSVVSDEGFWVGSSPEQRVFFHLSPAARGTGGESPFQVIEGQTVTVLGTVEPFNEAAVVGVDPAEGLDQVRAQGALVEVANISLAG